ncbi:hypothetical protein ACTFIZ_012739 [Dictyostelium cf. discoideum]
MSSRKFYFIILLVFVLFISAIKSSSSLVSSTNATPPSLILIVDCNKNNSYSIECGSSLEKSCKSIKDAVNYFIDFIGKPENINSSLVIQLVEGTYSSKAISFSSGWGLDITISPSPLNSKNVIIDGSDLENDLFDFDNKGVNSLTSKTYFKLSNVVFVNFASSTYSILYPATYRNMETEYTFNACRFFNSTNLKISVFGQSKQRNILNFIDSTFENVSFRDYSFFSTNYTVSFTYTHFNLVSFDNSFIMNDEGSKYEIYGCTFNQVSFGNKSSFIDASDISIAVSKFNKISGPKSSNPAYLLKLSNTPKSITVRSNTFNNIDTGFVELNNAEVFLTDNAFSNSNIQSPIIKSLNSTVRFDSNIYNYTSSTNNGQLIDCTGSTIYLENSVCEQTTTSTSSSTTGATTSNSTTTGPTSSTSSTTTTTGDHNDHPNSSIDAFKQFTPPLFSCNSLQLNKKSLIFKIKNII